MREILFRGKCGSDWHTGDLVHVYGMASIKEGRTKYTVDEETVGEYTGLTDRDGRRIFEGDILEGRYDEDRPEHTTEAAVFWAADGWRMRFEGGSTDRLDEFVCKYNRVVGNVHDRVEPLPRENPRKDEIWKHFKGGRYHVKELAMNTETEEDMVIYESEDGEAVFARPLKTFMSEVDRGKYPDATQKYRFERVR